MQIGQRWVREDAAGLQWEGLQKLAPRRTVPVWQRSTFLSGFHPWKFSCGDVVLCKNVSLDTGDQSDEEAKGPEVEALCLTCSLEKTCWTSARVSVRVYKLRKCFLRNTAKGCAFCSFLWCDPLEPLWPAF